MVVLQRRQTANFPQQANIASVSEIAWNFLEDEIVIGSARLRSPLASTALDFYDYTLCRTQSIFRQRCGGGRTALSMWWFKPKSFFSGICRHAVPLLEGSFGTCFGGFYAVRIHSASRFRKCALHTNLRAVWRQYPCGLGTDLSSAYGRFATELGLLRAGGQVSLQSIVSNVEVLQSLPTKPRNQALPHHYRKFNAKAAQMRHARQNHPTACSLPLYKH